MIHRLQFGDILQVKSRKKAGRWYCKAKIPAELSRCLQGFTGHRLAWFWLTS